MIKKLLAFLLLAGGALMLGVAIYDSTIITNLTNRFVTYFQTGIPNFINGMKQNPLATLASIGAILGAVITAGRWISGIKQQAATIKQQANQSINESSKIAYDSVKQVEDLKTEYTTKTEQQIADLQKSQELTTKLQIENDRLKRENEQLKTEYSVLQTEHESLKERVQLKKVIE